VKHVRPIVRVHVVAPVDDQPSSRKPRMRMPVKTDWIRLPRPRSALHQKVFLPRKMHELRATAVDEVKRYITKQKPTVSAKAILAMTPTESACPTCMTLKGAVPPQRVPDEPAHRSQAANPPAVSVAQRSRAACLQRSDLGRTAAKSRVQGGERVAEHRVGRQEEWRAEREKLLAPSGRYTRVRPATWYLNP